MFLEFEETTIRHSWPTTTDMTRSDTFPEHVDFMPSTAELSTVAQTACSQMVTVNGVAA